MGRRVRKFDGPLGRGLWWRLCYWTRLRREGSEGSKGSEGVVAADAADFKKGPYALRELHKYFNHSWHQKVGNQPQEPC